MDQGAGDDEREPLVRESNSVSQAFDGSEDITAARALARLFLRDVRPVHGLPVSGRVMVMVQVVVSELVTNARTYAPGRAC